MIGTESMGVDMIVGLLLMYTGKDEGGENFQLGF
jgi:hypothetical protein